MSDDKTTADIHLIRRILPHRYPYLMVDRVEEIDGIDTACGIKNVSMNEPHFQGHFPAYPIMPGVAIVESMAQTAAVMVGTTLDMADKNMLVYFMAIDRCKFRRMVGPGDVLHLKVKRLRGAAGGKVWKFEGRAEVAGELACEAEFTAKMEMTGL